MDHQRIDVDKMDEIMLPGFRFHPTDEELVGFYLKKKIQQRPLSVELIRQLDIYKYDPWDLPKLAATGEKEWYFYCPRDRKYRNSARPNRVTGAGFWKATGTDRPIYSSDAAINKCIGLKKSLVFFKGRAAKGTKTDWMMHEFRLPSLTDHSSSPSKRFMDKTIPANDSWAICRIFKKTNSTAQRALSQSWVSPPSETITPRTSTMTANRSSPIEFSNDFHQPSSIANHFPSFDHLLPSQHYISSNNNQCFPSNFMFSNTETCESSVLGDFGKACESIEFGGPQDHYLSLITLPKEIHVPNIMRRTDGDETTMFKNRSLMNIVVDDVQSGVPCNTSIDAWKSCFMWDSLPCPSDLSTPHSSGY